jgi:hypothetical protein
VKEELEVLNDKPLEESRVLDLNANWAISHQGKKRQREDSETLSFDRSEEEDSKEEEELLEDKS